jgi:hypothetical protein
MGSSFKEYVSIGARFYQRQQQLDSQCPSILFFFILVFLKKNQKINSAENLFLRCALARIMELVRAGLATWCHVRLNRSKGSGVIESR